MTTFSMKVCARTCRSEAAAPTVREQSILLLLWYLLSEVGFSHYCERAGLRSPWLSAARQPRRARSLWTLTPLRLLLPQRCAGAAISGGWGGTRRGRGLKGPPRPWAPARPRRAVPGRWRLPAGPGGPPRCCRPGGCGPRAETTVLPRQQRQQQEAAGAACCWALPSRWAAAPASTWRRGTACGNTRPLR